MLALFYYFKPESILSNSTRKIVFVEDFSFVRDVELISWNGDLRLSLPLLETKGQVRNQIFS